MYTSALDRDVDHILVSAEEIDRITTNIAARIDEDYREMDGKLLLLGILKGSVVFMGDLMKKITVPVEIDFMKVSSYRGDTKTSGRIKIYLDLNRTDISECNILIIEDIIDSGRTLSYLTEYHRLNGAKSVRTCSTSRRGGRSISRRITSVRRSRTNSRSDTVWTMRRSTALCRTSAY